MPASATPCPFCQQAHNELVAAYIQKDGKKPQSATHFVECLNCGARGPETLSYSSAVNAWELSNDTQNKHQPSDA